MSNTEVSSASNITADQFHPDENLLSILDSLRQNISDGKYSNNIQMEILESIESYVTGDQIKLDPQIVKFLVQGWWVQSAMEQIKTELEPTEPFICPLCLQRKVEIAIDENK